MVEGRRINSRTSATPAAIGRNADTAAAKISPPWLTGTYPRGRLFERLDAARRHPVIWINGPAGAGKTTLAADYLEARKLTGTWYQIDKGDEDIAGFFYYLGLAGNRIGPGKHEPLPVYSAQYALGVPTFSRNFFNQLFARLPRPSLLIFDNFHELAADARIQEIMRIGLEMVPPDCHIIVLSRHAPPPALARLRANGLMDVIGWRDLRLNRGETEGIVRLRMGSDAPHLLKDEDWLQNVQGWAAGLTLLLEWFKAEGAQPQALERGANEAVFDYFADELLAKVKPDTKDFLLRSAVLPQMSEAQARSLTGSEHTGEILAELVRRNFLITRHPGDPDVYRYHPLFRNHLLGQARASFSPWALRELKSAAAELLARDGQTEPAVELLRELRDWPRMAEMIKLNAQAMVAQGRYQTQAGWIDALPKAVREADPWLTYWLGNSLLGLDLARALTCFERAYARFRELGDGAGVCLAWSGAVKSIRYDWGGSHRRWDPWLAVLDEVAQELRRFPSSPIELEVATCVMNALAWRDPLHPKREAWRQRLTTLVDLDVGDFNMRADGLAEALLVAFTHDDRVRAYNTRLKLESFLARGEPAPFVQTGALAWRALCYLGTGRLSECREAAREGLAIAEAMGVNFHRCYLMLFNGAASLLTGDHKGCKEMVNQMAALPDSRGGLGGHFYHQLAASEAMARLDWTQALAHTKQSLKAADQAGGMYFESWGQARYAMVCFESRQFDEADKAIDKALDCARHIAAPWLIWGCLIDKAYFALHRADETPALDILREAFALGRIHGYKATPGVRRPVLLALCKTALQTNIETDYARGLIRTFDFKPNTPPLHIEHWPWPLRIYTLGRFEIHRDEQSVDFGRKAPKKSLQLIKVLAAYGGRNVDSSELIDALWPELEGDKAQHALKTALQRLRRLIGAEIVTLGQGQVSLNPHHCWLDTWAFKHLVKQAETATTQDDRQRRREQALSLYQGHFLAGEPNAPWSGSPRNRLRGAYIRLIGELALARERQGAWNLALECWQRGLEIDDLAEAFYQGTMRSYARLGLKAEALNIFHRCKRHLSISLSTHPSTETERLYREIAGG